MLWVGSIVHPNMQRYYILSFYRAEVALYNNSSDQPLYLLSVVWMSGNGLSVQPREACSAFYYAPCHLNADPHA